MSWRKLRGVHLPYEKQVYIRATCLLWKDQPKRVQEKIRRLCEECGVVYASALWESMTTKQRAVQIALKHNMSESTLYRIRVEFYNNW